MLKYLLLIIAIPAHGAQSLMLSIDEQKIATQVLKKASDEQNNTIKLNAIVFNSPDDWTLWINGKKIDCHEQDLFTVKKVSKDNAELYLTHEARTIKLRVNEQHKLEQA